MNALLVGLVVISATGQGDPPAAPGSIGPNLSRDAKGDVLLTWIEGNEVRMARRTKAGWSKPTTLVKSDTMFANWADFPSIAARDGEMVGHFLEKSSDETYAYDVELFRSKDGRRFARTGAAHDDGTPTEHGFASIVPDGAGFQAFWLDGREMVTKKPMTLRAGRIVDGKVASSTVLDARVCECCQTSAAVTAEGPFVVYRDRTAEEIRNISVVRRTKSGWSSPATVHDDGWKMPGCPVNGPAADAKGKRAVVAWYTGADLGKVRVAFSDDAARTFVTHEVHDNPDTIPLGRVDVVLVDDGAIVSWLVAEGDDARILFRHVGRDGRLGRPRTVAMTSPARSSGFPRVAPVDEGLLFVWTEVGPPSRIRARVVALDDSSKIVVAKAKRPKPADYVARTLDGEKASLASLKGPVLLNLWATWCGPCRREMPDLQRLADRCEGLEVVGVSVDEATADVAKVVARTGVRYRIWRDPEDRVSRIFGARALPASYLIDAKGDVVFERAGVIEANDAEVSKALRALGVSCTDP